MNLPKNGISKQLHELPEKLGICESSSAKSELGRLLHTIVHDLNTSLGIFDIGFYSLQTIFKRLRDAIEVNDMDTIRRQISTMAEVLSNLEGGYKTTIDIVSAIEEAGTRLKET